MTTTNNVTLLRLMRRCSCSVTELLSLFRGWCYCFESLIVVYILSNTLSVFNERLHGERRTEFPVDANVVVVVAEKTGGRRQRPNEITISRTKTRKTADGIVVLTAERRFSFRAPRPTCRSGPYRNDNKFTVNILSLRRYHYKEPK